MSWLTPTSSADLVCILDNDNFNQLFVASSPMRVSVREARRSTRFAVEDGTERSDHVVIEAVEISIDLFVESPEARNSYQDIRQAWSENRLVTVQTSIATYPDMLITEIPHDETTDRVGTLIMPVRMVEWRSYEPQFGALPPQKVKNKSQSSTVQSGEKQTTETGDETERRASVLYGVMN